MDEEKEKIVAVYEDARSEANIAVWAIKLQLQRLNSKENEIPDFVLQPIVDFHFLVTALTRLRKMAELVSKYSDISEGIKKFDEALPDLKNIRNVLEHLDEYRMGKGRNKSVSVNGLRTIMVDPNRIHWLDYEINGNEALGRLPENGIPDRAGFSFVIKARQQAHSRTMSLLSQHRGRTKRQAGWYVI
jgi:hypothetical protein